ncbi:helix-turn-helix domain-containing protein [Hungatella hathewayi]|uniref:response regulator transcription factor n=1 Tax=Hungatella hathewayi TaxID=154046 RepID=UPI0003367409|nr:helix-turn-helix domain-containing protein [Hungatella hathewayi]CCZ62051.1 dNA-bindng response regulator AraC family [Hungatella hathewayi CAG:224]
MYRVLIADDEEIERLSFSRKLKKYFGESCEVFQVENGMQAILSVDKNDTPIVIMDIGMPGMNGVEAAEWIRKSHPDCVIIFLTAYDDFSYAKRAVSLHALEYLLKPCDDEELIPVMEEAMRQVDLCRGRRASQAAGRSGGRSGDGGRSENGTEGAPGQAGERDAGTGRERDTDPEEAAENGYSRVAAAIRAYVRENYSRDISMQDAARAMNYSEVYFCRLFKQCFDQNFTAYLTRLRVKEAKKLLEDPRANIKDVSRSVGYSDSKYFSKIFKRITGQLPSEYRDGLPPAK